ncbi:PRK06851 family protein [Paenibacillus sp. SAFN-117]|uniref:PRK06851 family protein n=1 Tax=Paenibacillus sp. SAFN-117 TaxID=3436860 RepID=UPI003F7DC6AD
MRGQAKSYFIVGNTAKGPHSLFDSAYSNVKSLYVLTGGPGTGKSAIIRNLANTMQERGWDVELYHSSLDSEDLDGMIVAGLQAGLIDGTACPEALQSGVGNTLEVFDLDEAVDRNLLQADESRMSELQQEIEHWYNKAIDTYNLGLQIHDEWEKIYIDNMDHAAADRITRELADSLFGVRKDSKPAKVIHRYLGAATSRGPVDFIMPLTEGLPRRIFVKGRPGSGKSTMMKKLAAEAERQGYDVEMFHCGFDPNSLDMLIFPDINVAIFDSTAPHEHFPSRAGDEILDMYEKTFPPGIDEKYADSIAEIRARYTSAMGEANACLAKVKSLRDEWKRLYRKGVDSAKVAEIESRIRGAFEKQVHKI